MPFHRQLSQRLMRPPPPRSYVHGGYQLVFNSLYIPFFKASSITGATVGARHNLEVVPIMRGAGGLPAALPPFLSSRLQFWRPGDPAGGPGTSP